MNKLKLQLVLVSSPLTVYSSIYKVMMLFSRVSVVIADQWGPPTDPPCFCIAGTPDGALDGALDSALDGALNKEEEDEEVPAGCTIWRGWSNSAAADGCFSPFTDTVHVVFLRSNSTAPRPLLVTTDGQQAQQYVDLAMGSLAMGSSGYHELSHELVDATVIWTASVVVRWDLPVRA